MSRPSAHGQGAHAQNRTVANGLLANGGGIPSGDFSSGLQNNFNFQIGITNVYVYSRWKLFGYVSNLWHPILDPIVTV